MSTSVISSVQTRGVGFAPILRYFCEKCGISEIIDDNVALDPRRKVLSHGQACVAMITGILFHTSSTSTDVHKEISITTLNPTCLFIYGRPCYHSIRFRKAISPSSDGLPT